MIQRRRSEEGFTLVAVMALALLATFAVFAVLTLFRHETKTLQATNVRDRLESALDTGLEKAVLKLNESGSWANLDSTAYFNSLTATSSAFADLDGYQYWVMVLKGKRVQPVAGVINDTMANALTNTGDLNLSRTVIIRAKNTRTNVELRAMALLHRSDVSPIIPVGGIYTNGSLNNGGWPGTSYNSCSGVSRTAQPAGCSGTVQAGGAISSSSGFCMPQVTVGPTPQPYPPVGLPAGTEPWPFESLQPSINSDYSAPSGNHAYSYSVTRTMKVQVRNVSLGNDDFNIITNGFQVDVYVTGSLGAGGNCSWTTRGLNPGGQPASMWFRVVGSGAVTLSGTGTYECVIEAPESAVNLNGGGTGSFSGGIVANTFNKNGAAGNFYFDECILQKYKANTYPRPPIITVGWSQF